MDKVLRVAMVTAVFMLMHDTFAKAGHDTTSTKACALPAIDHRCAAVPQFPPDQKATEPKQEAEQQAQYPVIQCSGTHTIHPVYPAPSVSIHTDSAVVFGSSSDSDSADSGVICDSADSGVVISSSTDSDSVGGLELHSQSLHPHETAVCPGTVPFPSSYSGLHAVEEGACAGSNHLPLSTDESPVSSGASSPWSDPIENFSLDGSWYFSDGDEKDYGEVNCDAIEVTFESLVTVETVVNSGSPPSVNLGHNACCNCFLYKEKITADVM
ncbi:hypothetical protein ACOMHN_014267 [Nucella lapillus]